MNDLAEPDALHRDRQSGENGLEVGEAIAAHSGNHEPEAKGFQIVLVLKRSIDSDEYVALEDTRLGGHALEDSLFGEFNKPEGLRPAYGWEVCQELFNCGAAFPMVDQCLDRDSRSPEARRAAHPLRVNPYHLVERGLLFRGHISKLSRGSEPAPPASKRARD